MPLDQSVSTAPSVAHSTARGVMMRCAASDITVSTSAPWRRNSRAKRTVSTAAMPPLTPNTTRRPSRESPRRSTPVSLLTAAGHAACHDSFAEGEASWHPPESPTHGEPRRRPRAGGSAAGTELNPSSPFAMHHRSTVFILAVDLFVLAYASLRLRPCSAWTWDSPDRSSSRWSSVACGPGTGLADHGPIGRRSWSWA